MTSYARQAIILGVIITLLVVGIELLGAFDALERETISLRFAHARWRDEPLDNKIRFVDIDDGALDAHGRWPWPRSKLADAIKELHRAEVGTIAIDLLLDNPENSEYRPRPDDSTDHDANMAEAGTLANDPMLGDPENPEYQLRSFDLIDHDASLSEALEAVQCVLAVSVDAPLPFGKEWQTGEGPAELDRLLDVLRSDIQLDPDQAIEQAKLTEPRDARYRTRPLEFKKIVAYEKLRQMSKQPDSELTFEQFEQAIAPRVNEKIRVYPEMRLLLNAWQQHKAWRHVQQFLLPESSDGSYQDSAPLPRFAEHADAFGFVNRRAGPEGDLRSIAPLLPADGGQVVQFGLAAAAIHQNRQITDLRVEDGHLVLGRVELPLVEGQLWLAWPTTPTDWKGALRRAQNQEPTAGHISIGWLISLAEQRRLHAENKALQMRLAQRILALETLPEELSQAQLIEIREDVQDNLDVRQEMIDNGEWKDQDESGIAQYTLWRSLEEAIEDGTKLIAEAVKTRNNAELKGKLVFIGMTATSIGVDTVPTPLGPETPGVFVHAVVADMAMNGPRVQLAPWWTGWALAALMGLLCTSLAARLTPAFSTMFVLVTLAGYVVVAGWWFFGSEIIGSVFPMVAPVTAGAGSWIACTALKATLFQRDRWRITRRFKARVAPELVDYLVENPNAVSMIGEQREVTVMFLDLAGFTAMPESLDGAIVVGALNRCMSELTRHITHHEGYVNKFLGDGLMAFWSAFRPDPKQAVRACTSALECRDGLARLNRSEGFAHLPSFSARFGIATGKVIVGDCGAPPQLNDYTVIGNEVNLAARLESANKQFGTSILITDRTRDQLGPDKFRTRPIGRIIVVGQTVPVSVYELLPGDADSTMIELTTQAVEAFARREYPASTAAWKRLTDTFGPSKLAEFYLEAIADQALVVNGALRLHEK